jgi:hypothetical protein
MNDEWKGCGRRRPWAGLRRYHGIYVGTARFRCCLEVLSTCQILTAENNKK